MVTEIVISPTRSGTLSITIGTANVYGIGTLFVVGDVGKQITIRTSAGDHHTVISSWVSATEVLVLNAPTITEAGCYYSMDFYSLDLYDDFPYSYNYSIADIRLPEGRNSSYSKTIRIPGTKGNNTVLAHVYEINLDGTFNVNLRSECLVTADTIQIFKGNLQLTKIIKNNEKIEYEVTVYGKTGNLFNDLGSKLLTELDLSEYSHVPSKTNQANSWATSIYQGGIVTAFSLGNGYVYPVINNGLDTFQAATPNFTVTNIYPALYVKTIIDKMFSQLDYSYNSNFFNTTYFKSLIIPAIKYPTRQVVFRFTSPGYTPVAGGAFTIRIKKLSIITGTTSNLYSSSVGTVGLVHSTGLIEVVEGDLIYVQIDKTAGTVITTNGGIFSAAYNDNYNNLASENGDFQATDTLTVPAFSIPGGGWVVPFDDDSTGSNFDNCDTFNITTHKQTVPHVNLAGILTPNIKQRDFLLAIIKMFNLYVEPDRYGSNILNIEPRDDFYAAGTTVDWTAKLDLTKDIEIIPMGDLNFNQYLLTYKEDSDYLNSDYSNRYKEVYGQHIDYIATDFQSSKNAIELIFSPTPSAGSTMNPLVVPTILKENTTALPNNVNGNIRILYYAGLLTGAWTHIDGSGSTARSTYPYSGHLDNPQTPTLDILFDAPKLRYWIMTDPSLYPDANLFNLYYQKFLDEITDKNSKIVVAYFHLTPLDIYNLDFRSHFFIDNTYYRLNKIIDYNPLSTDTTKVELIKIKEAIHVRRPAVISSDSNISVSTNLGSPLGVDEIFVGSSTGIAKGIAVAGDVSMASGRVKVNAIRNNEVQDVVPNDGDVYVWVDANSRFEPQAPASGSGDVVGPAVSVDSNIALFDGITGKLLKDGAKKISDLAPLASPTFTGNPKAPTPTVGDNDTSIATTAFVVTALSGSSPTGSNLYLFYNLS